jgi:hypothetical protein
MIRIKQYKRLLPQSHWVIQVDSDAKLSGRPIEKNIPPAAAVVCGGAWRCVAMRGVARRKL